MDRNAAGVWIVWFALVFSLLAPWVIADTGTYIIHKEYADLFIQNDGNVIIKYEIDIETTGGNIPWVTLVLPNSNYEIVTWTGNAKTVKRWDSSGWTGVRIDLDKTYHKGEHAVFTVEVMQKGFIYKYDGDASIQFIPVHWDRAVIKHLKVTFWTPENTTSVKTSSEPTTFGDENVMWEWFDVPKGVKKDVGMRMDIGLFTHFDTPDTSPTTRPFPTTRPGGQHIEPSVPSEPSILEQFWWLLPIAFSIIIFPALFGSGSRSTYESPTFSSISTGRSVTRRLNMECPRCKPKARLDKRDIKGPGLSLVTIDFCDKCGGAYFDKGEVATLIKNKVKESQFNKNKIIKFNEVPLTPLIDCPRCGEDMKKKQADYIKIDVCDDCISIWLDRGEYTKIKKRRLEQEKEYDKKKHDDNWFIFWYYLGATGPGSSHAGRYGGGKSGGGGSSGDSGSSSGGASCACVSCACVSACACACACAGGGGGAAGCGKTDIKGIKLNGKHEIKGRGLK